MTMPCIRCGDPVDHIVEEDNGWYWTCTDAVRHAASPDANGRSDTRGPAA